MTCRECVTIGLGFRLEIFQREEEINRSERNEVRRQKGKGVPTSHQAISFKQQTLLIKSIPFWLISRSSAKGYECSGDG
ncbi:hypothetical protein HanXRQr2_Chr13g0573761 [Helianthus annuus]|uniref:Uncharacterized protein n=1 Tax=Helianthus annuus TaxID=4232 RepID=A0A9K3HBB1_HELAN|nr:hypothetical protein HanXRQr2_Chr13g0573761 [Helianthus annuus]